MENREFVKVYCCGDCIHYDWKKHGCKLGACEEGKAQDHFFRDCPQGIHKDLKPVESVSETHGHWIGKPIAGYATVRCSNCKSAFLENKGIWKYCPDCGARMDEVAE